MGAEQSERVEFQRKPRQRGVKIDVKRTANRKPVVVFARRSLTNPAVRSNVAGPVGGGDSGNEGGDVQKGGKPRRSRPHKY